MQTAWVTPSKAWPSRELVYMGVIQEAVHTGLKAATSTEAQRRVRFPARWTATLTVARPAALPALLGPGTVTPTAAGTAAIKSVPPREAQPRVRFPARWTATLTVARPAALPAVPGPGTVT